MSKRQKKHEEADSLRASFFMLFGAESAVVCIPGALSVRIVESLHFCQLKNYREPQKT